MQEESSAQKPPDIPTSVKDLVRTFVRTGGANPDDVDVASAITSQLAHSMEVVARNAPHYEAKIKRWGIAARAGGDPIKQENVLTDLRNQTKAQIAKLADLHLHSNDEAHALQYFRRACEHIPVDLWDRNQAQVPYLNFKLFVSTIWQEPESWDDGVYSLGDFANKLALQFGDKAQKTAETPGQMTSDLVCELEAHWRDGPFDELQELSSRFDGHASKFERLGEREKERLGSKITLDGLYAISDYSRERPAWVIGGGGPGVIQPKFKKLAADAGHDLGEILGRNPGHCPVTFWIDRLWRSYLPFISDKERARGAPSGHDGGGTLYRLIEVSEEYCSVLSRELGELFAKRARLAQTVATVSRTEATDQCGEEPDVQRDRNSEPSSDEAPCLHDITESDKQNAKRDPIAQERKDLLLEYKRQCKDQGIYLTDKMIAKAADLNWNDRTPVDRWKRNDRSPVGGADDNRIRNVLRDKPHLSKQ